MLVFALVVSSLMGLYQEKLYATHGKYPEEALFYSVSSPHSISLSISSNSSASSSFTSVCIGRKRYLPTCSTIQSIK